MEKENGSSKLLEGITVCLCVCVCVCVFMCECDVSLFDNQVILKELINKWGGRGVL